MLMIDFPILSLLIFIPLLGAFFVLTIKGEESDVANNARYVALYASSFNFILSVFLLMNFDGNRAGFQFVEYHSWFPSQGFAYHLGVDGISIWLLMLTTFFIPICVLASWDSIKFRVKEYMTAFLILETLIIGAFCALDMVLFYLFFEGVLVPMFLVIGIWGGNRRIYAAYKFFLFTLLGSLLMLVAMIVLYLETGTTSIPELIANPVGEGLQIWLWLAFFASFAIKMPMWPGHTWLPDAHVEAPTAGSVILAGVLLKMGGYGFLRFSLPMFPEASEMFIPLVFTLSIIAIVYASLVAFVQDDMKTLIAYSSIAHMGFVTLGIFSATEEGVKGALFHMLSHGIISGALFLSVGVLYSRMHTRDLREYGGVVNNMPVFAVVFMILMLGSVGLPGTTGFVGEVLALTGTYKASIPFAVIAALGIVLGATYMLSLYKRIFYGEHANDRVAVIEDLTIREKIVLLPIVVLVLLPGIFPDLILSDVSASVESMLSGYAKAVNSGG